MSLLTPPTSPSATINFFSIDAYPSKRPSYRTQAQLPTPPYSPIASIESSPKRQSPYTAFRQLSDNELSYYLPSRQDGVNDMYLHHRLQAPSHLMASHRILHIWSLLLLSHPLLSSQIRSSSYTDVSFNHSHPTTLKEALQQADDLFNHFPSSDPVNLIDEYLNGNRTLSNDRLAMLFVKGGGEEAGWEVMLTATHFLGDGMALHTLMNELYTLLGSEMTVEDLENDIERMLNVGVALPAGLEERLSVGSELAELVGREEYPRSEGKNIGGQSFPSSRTKRERKTVVPTFAYSEEETKRILSKCKKNGVTIAHAVFALCNIAWARLATDRQDPCLIYSALNLRPHMTPSESSYFHLAVGYFNIVLPTLLPPIPTSDLFWHRARTTKAQTTKAVKSPFAISRFRNTSKIRAAKSVKWAKIDDEELEAKTGLGFGGDFFGKDPITPGPKIAPVRAVAETPAPTPLVESKQFPVSDDALAPASQKALMGVSMLGNLDGMYKHDLFPEIRLESLTTGSRQRSGGLLLFAYTFTGKLWLSLGYDVNGFQDGVIEAFWREVQNLVKGVLL